MLLISSFQTDYSVCEEDASGQSDRYHCSTRLEGPDLVCQPHQSTENIHQETQRKRGQLNPSKQSVSRVASVSRSSGSGSLLVRSMDKCNLSKRVKSHLLKSWRPKTIRQYQVYHRRWNTFCIIKGIDPLTANLNNGLDFLCELFDKGLRYSALNSARSALSCVLGLTEGMKFGCHPLTIRLLKSFYNQRPPMARYSSIWNINVVLDYLRELTPLSSLSLKMLSFKTVMLLLLCTCSRQQRLLNIKRSHISYEVDGSISIRISILQKHSRKGRSLEILKLQEFKDDRGLCVVNCVKTYLQRTSDHVGDNDIFLCSFRAPHRAIGSQTLARWSLTVMKEAGVDVSVFKTHSTRSASASYMINTGTPLSHVLKQGAWTDECTFREFYLRDVPS